MSNSDAKTRALALLTDPALRTTGAPLVRLQKSVVEQLAHIRGLESEAALRAIFTGLGLHLIKANVGHGQFGPWIEKNVEGAGVRQCQFYMKLALAFLAKAKLAKTEMLVLADGRCDLAEAKDAAARKFFGRVQGFVGELSLNELLEKHGIKGLTRDTGDSDAPLDVSATPAGAGGQMLFAEIAQHFESIRKTVLTHEALMQMSPKQLDAVKREFDDTHAQFSKLYQQARGAKK